MLNVRADDIEGNVEQAVALEKAGCESVRVAVPDYQAVRLVEAIKSKISIPLVAAIHFDYKLALECVAAGIDKVRINPGNIGDDGHVKAVEIIYNQFKNASTQILQCEQFLPIELKEAEEEKSSKKKDYIYEPNKSEILSNIIPQSLKMQMYKCFLDSFASEHGARMTSMHKATDNAESLLKELKLTYNKARQAAITNEIIEICSGAEALNG